MIQRLIVTIILTPLGLYAIYLGGWAYGLTAAVLVGIAAWEYVQLSKAAGHRPSQVLVIGGVLLLLLQRGLNGFEYEPFVLGLLILIAFAYHMLMYERGRDQAVTDMGMTLLGILYLGWIGSFLLSLRALPDGQWWTLIILPAVWLADSGAYWVGKNFGKHLLSPRLSPKKTWEGYWGGAAFGTLTTWLLSFAWQAGAGPGSEITPLRALLLGLAMGLLPTLGDLAESMIKRSAGVKDSGTLLPGHGGAFDRIDSWLWAGVIGYYLIAWFVK